MTYSAPAPDRSALPTRAQDSRKVVPHPSNRIGALVATAGLALALISLYLPWLHADSGSFTALDITSVIDVRSVAPVLFLGLVVMMLLVAVSLVTRLGAAATAAAAVSAVGLIAHVAFMWILYDSAGTADPTLAGLPAGAGVSWGPYVAALGFLEATLGSAWAAKSATIHLSDL